MSTFTLFLLGQFPAKPSNGKIRFQSKWNGTNSIGIGYTKWIDLCKSHVTKRFSIRTVSDQMDDWTNRKNFGLGGEWTKTIYNFWTFVHWMYEHKPLSVEYFKRHHLEKQNHPSKCESCVLRNCFRIINQSTHSSISSYQANDFNLSAHTCAQIDMRYQRERERASMSWR